jgi:AcrR family transcriptional regulator
MAARKATVGRRSDQEAERTRRHIISAARRLFAAHGFDAVALRDIAARARTTHALVRHHFGSKLGIWRAVVEVADAEYVAALAPLLAAPPTVDVVAEATAFIEAFVAVSVRFPDFTRLLLHEGASRGPRLTHLMGYLDGAAERMAPLVSRLHARGLLRSFDATSFFHFLLFAGGAPFAMSPLSQHLLGALNVEAVAARLVAVLVGPPSDSSQPGAHPDRIARQR